MRICIPAETNNGLGAKVNAHFGSAPYFIIYNTDKDYFEVINNSDQSHVHGMCHPLSVLDNCDIDVVVCRGMGTRAVQKLNEGGIKAYKATAQTIREIIEKYKQGSLEEITIRNSCTEHKCH